MTRISRKRIRVTVDAGLRDRLVRAALRAVLRPWSVARGWLGWFVVAGVVWLLTDRLWPALVVAPGVPAVLLLRALIGSRRRVLAAVSVGTVLSSSYKGGRLVITRATGDLVLAQGSARSVERVGDVSVVRWRARRGPLVTPSALLTDADVALLTGDPPARDLPFSVVVTKEVRRNVYVGTLASVARRPLAIALLLAYAGWLLLVLPDSQRGYVATVLLMPLLLAGVTWLLTRHIYRLGRAVRAGVTEEGLALDLPLFAPLVPRSSIRRIVRTGRCIVVTLRNGRQIVLPRELLQPAAMRTLTGHSPQESDAR